jgi:hypothetical protein
VAPGADGGGTPDRRLGHARACSQELCALPPKATAASLFDHLVGEHEQRVRNGNAKRPGGLEVDHQLLVIIKGLEDAFLFCSRRAANCRSLTYVRTIEKFLSSCFGRAFKESSIVSDVWAALYYYSSFAKRGGWTSYGIHIDCGWFVTDTNSNIW